MQVVHELMDAMTGRGMLSSRISSNGSLNQSMTMQSVFSGYMALLAVENQP
jgi:hypothetical protein